MILSNGVELTGGVRIFGDTVVTMTVQNVAGTNNATGLFFLGNWITHPESSFQYIQPGWKVVGQPTWIVIAVGDGVTDETITITGGVFVSGGSYAFTNG